MIGQPVLPLLKRRLTRRPVARPVRDQPLESSGEPAAEPARSSDSAASAPSPESRSERYARHGRRLRLYAGAGVFVALLAVLIVLTSKNTRTVKLDWAIGSTHASLVWIILAAAVVGWLLGITTAVVFHHRTRRP